MRILWSVVVSWSIAALSLSTASCGNIRAVGGAGHGAGSAVIYNAIDFGVANSTYFVVSRVNGETVHRKFDRDRGVRVAAGDLDLEVRFYSEGMADSPAGAAQCRCAFAASSAAEYYVEGAAQGDRWRARIVDGTGGVVSGCVFAGSAEWGLIVGGRKTVALSALSLGAAALASAAVGAGQTESAPPPELPAVAEIAAGFADETGADTDAPAAGHGSAGTVLALPASPPSSSDARPSDEPSWQPASALGAVRGFVGGRGRWGCAPGSYRVSNVRGDVIALSGNERVRLLGATPRDAAAYERVLRHVEGACVRMELDQLYKPSDHRDRDGMLVAYVFGPGDNMLNAEVIGAGVAVVDTTVRYRYLGALLAAQDAAQRARRGIWTKE